MVVDTFKGFQIKGLHLDLKAQTLRFSAMCDIVRDAAGWGYNTILLEYQDKFPFKGELATLAAPDALTEEEVQEFVRLCHKLGVEIIPLVQSIGHMYYVLLHEEFAHLGEEKGAYAHMHALCPSNPDSFIFFTQMADQIMQLHPDSRYFHIGGDETRLSDTCPRCAGREKLDLLSRRYQDCCDWVIGKHDTPVIWSDMLLTHPELLSGMKNRVVIMDWDYWSTDRPSGASHLWGIEKHNPDHWPVMHQALFEPFVYRVKPHLLNPFPYVRFLKEQGFEVLAAPAARSSGDPNFIPMSLHKRNCLEAVYSAAQAGAMGVVVTSWSLRRAPWPTTENSLIAAAMAMENPGVRDDEIDYAFSEAHFGVADLRLAALPDLLADAAQKAAKVVDLFTAGLSYPAGDMGHVEDYPTRLAIKQQQLIGNTRAARVYDDLTFDARSALRTLERACPTTPAQHYRTAVWNWVAETALFFGEFIPALTESQLSPSRITRFENALLDLRAKNRRILSPLLTDYAMQSDDQARVGIHLDYLNSMK